MASGSMFFVEMYLDGDWQMVQERSINRLRPAIDLAQSTASREAKATRVVNGNGKVKARFEANGQRPNRRRRRKTIPHLTARLWFE
jgi:hypothetical protein